jgi:hypothetical protein
MRDPDSAYDFKHGTMQDLPTPEKSPLYWADGICINQDDTNERNQQVTLMGDIYRKAYRVVTYISEGNEERWMGILLGIQLQQYVHKTYPRPPDPRIMDVDRLEELGFPHQSNPQWRYLRDVLRLPWSSRMWIVQETILNQNITMKCGRLEFPWSVLGEMSVLASRGYIPFLAITDTVSPHVGLPASTPASMKTMLGLRSQAMAGHNRFSTLRLLLCECHHLESTDPRDKVYALANISKDWAVLDITPDYSCSVEKLYVDVAFRIMRLEKSLAILAAATSNKALTNLPSWVPDWSAAPTPYFLDGPSDVKEKNMYAASGTTPAMIEYNEADRVFRTAGVFIDRIEYVTEVIGASHFRRKPQWFEEILKMVQEVSSNNLKLGGSKSPMEALWRTLIANLAVMEALKPDVEAPEWYSLYFEAFVHLQAALAGMEKGIDYTITQEKYDKALAFDKALTRQVNSRSLCRTKNGFLGLVHEGTCIGDDVSILFGGRMPYILKRSGNTTRFAGEAYIHGLMKGEGMQHLLINLQRIEINS